MLILPICSSCIVHQSCHQLMASLPGLLDASKSDSTASSMIYHGLCREASGLLVICPSLQTPCVQWLRTNKCRDRAVGSEYSQVPISLLGSILAMPSRSSHQMQHHRLPTP